MKKRVGRPVAVIGELNVDAIATGLRQPPRLGAEILAADFRLTLGSASAIFACGMAKLGHAVTFFSQVGTDDFGKFCLRALKEAGVSTRNVRRDDTLKTGVSVSLSTGRDRALVTYPGAISSMKYEQIRMSALKGLGHLHMTSFFLQADLRPSFGRIFGEAKRLGLTTSFDPNSDPSSEGGEDVSAPGFRVEAVDTTGAGDSFAAGFMSAYLRGLPVAECLRHGNACGALSTLQAGGTPGQPDAKALEKFLAAH